MSEIFVFNVIQNIQSQYTEDYVSVSFQKQLSDFSLCFNSHYFRLTLVSFSGAKDDISNVITGTIKCAKLYSNHHHQQTKTPLFTGRMPLMLPNQQHQSTEGKSY